jgi:transcriptional regulator with XRE-family HTH domain
MTQAQLAERLGLSRSRVSEIERGAGRTAAMETWVRLGIVLRRPLGMSFARDLVPEPADAGHLEAQELVLRFAAMTGRSRKFELPTRASVASPSVDVALRDDRERVLVLVEIRNRVDDLGRGARSSDGKMLDVESVAIAIGFGRPYRVSGCWLLVDSVANRARPSLLGGLAHSVPRILAGMDRGIDLRRARSGTARDRVGGPSALPAGSVALPRARRRIQPQRRAPIPFPAAFVGSGTAQGTSILL